MIGCYAGQELFVPAPSSNNFPWLHPCELHIYISSRASEASVPGVGHDLIRDLAVYRLAITETEIVELFIWNI